MKYLNPIIIECEMEYYKCFSNYQEKDTIIRFRDNKLPDMDYHNFTYIKKIMVEREIKNIINSEIEYSIYENTSFCNILLQSHLSRLLISSFKHTPIISISGYYLFDISKIENMNIIEGCMVKKVINQSMVDDVSYCDSQHDEYIYGKDFGTRKPYRRGEVYLGDNGVNSYICYHDTNIIGSCDLFIHNNIAKIEDFEVIPKYQRKGYGTSILKSIIEVAIKENCNTIYLVTDEADTAKEMYKKLGFIKISERTDLFFKLS